MDFERTYAPRDQDVAAENFDGEVVALDLANGRYFSLSAGAGAVWHALVEGHSIATLFEALPPSDERREMVLNLVGALLEQRLLIAREGKAALGIEPVALDFADFTFEAFDDLADLLVADPIHDVDDAAGWPHRPSQQD